MWVCCDAAPGLSAVVAVVCSAVSLSLGAARCAVERAWPDACDVVVAADDDPVGIVRVNGDGWLVLGCSCGVLVDGYVW